MTRFRKHDFGFFSSKEELQEALTRKKASIVFKAINEDVSIDEFYRTNLKLMLLEAVELGINRTYLAKDRFELMLDGVDGFIDLVKSGKTEGLTEEEVLEMWKEESKELKEMTEEEIYDAFSH